MARNGTPQQSRLGTVVYTHDNLHTTPRMVQYDNVRITQAEAIALALMSQRKRRAKHVQPSPPRRFAWQDAR